MEMMVDGSAAKTAMEEVQQEQVEEEEEVSFHDLDSLQDFGITAVRGRVDFFLFHSCRTFFS